MNFYTALLEQYILLESLETTIKSNPHIPESIIRGYHSNALPDNNKNDRLLNHVLKMHKSGAITPETAHQLKPHLTALAATNQLNKLGSLNTIKDHINATKDIMDKSVTKKQKVDKDTPVLLNTPDVLVRQHLNHESAEKAARLHPENPMYNVPKEKGKASWCVSLGGQSGKTHFDHYTENGKNPMYTIYNKKTKRIHALVANPNDTRDTVELRDENDKQPYIANADLHTFLRDHPGIEHTPAGVHLNKLTDEHIKQENEKLLEAMRNGDKLHAALLDNNISESNRIKLLSSPHITEKHIYDIITNPNDLTRLKIRAIESKMHRYNIKDIQKHSKPLMDILKNPNADKRLKRSVAMSPRLSSEHADYIINGNDDGLKNTLLTHNAEYLTTDHVNNIMNGDDYRLKRRVLNDLDQHITPQHVHNIIMEPHSQDPIKRRTQGELTKDVLANYPHYIKDDHINHIMTTGNEQEKRAAFNSDAFEKNT